MIIEEDVHLTSLEYFWQMNAPGFPLPEFGNGSTFYNDDDHKTYVWINGRWEEINDH